MSVPGPVEVFTVVAVALLLLRRVSVPVWIALVLFGMLIAGTWVADVVAYPLADIWSHL